MAIHDETLLLTGMSVERAHNSTFEIKRISTWILGERSDTRGQGASCTLMLCDDLSPALPQYRGSRRAPVLLDFTSPAAMRHLARLLEAQADRLEAFRAVEAQRGL